MGSSSTDGQLEEEVEREGADQDPVTKGAFCNLCDKRFKMVGSVGSPMRSQSLARLHAVSPNQFTARRLVRKYSLPQYRLLGQRKELASLRSTLPHMKAASDLDLVLEAIKYIEQLQQKVVVMSKQKQKEESSNQEESQES